MGYGGDMVNKRWAMARNGLVENVVIWDGVTEWDYGDFEVFELEEGSVVGIGWVLVDGVWSAPVQPEPVVEPVVDPGVPSDFII